MRPLTTVSQPIPLTLFGKTILLGFFYTAIYTLLATLVFYGKEL